MLWAYGVCVRVERDERRGRGETRTHAHAHEHARGMRAWVLRAQRSVRGLSGRRAMKRTKAVVKAGEKKKKQRIRVGLR